MKETQELTPSLSPKAKLHMKGQSIPLLGYHLIRDHVLSTITGEFQSSILYWAGKSLAARFQLESFEECRNFFLDAGWGYLEPQQSTPYMQRFILDSPQFQYRSIKEHESTFALECGFLSQTLALIEQKETEGEYKLLGKEQKDYVEIKVYFQGTPETEEKNPSPPNKEKLKNEQPKKM